MSSNESKDISSNLFGHLIVNFANKKYDGFVELITDGELHDLGKQALRCSRVLDDLNDLPPLP